MDDALLQTIAELGARLTALEEAVAASGPASVVAARTADDGAARTADGGVFWILDGLRQRVDPPGAVAYAGSVVTAAGPVEWQIARTADQIMEDDWSAYAANLAALGHPVRLSLLHAILGGAGTVGELSAGDGMGTTGQLYHHLNQLVAQGWLIARGRGHYGIPPERVVPLMVVLTAARRIG